MKSIYISLFLVIFFAFQASSCTKSEDPLTPPNDATVTSCDSTLLPIIMAHGFLASGDTYEKQILRFISNGICPDRIFAYDWNTLGGANNVSLLDAFIDQTLQQTGASAVYLCGHSAGSNLSYEYLSQPERAAKVAAYVHLAGSGRSGPAGPEGSIKTLNIYSTADPIVSGADINGAENLRFTDKDHYEVATSVETFNAMYTFFFDKVPQTTEIKISEKNKISLAGKCITLGENQPKPNASIEVYEVDPNTGLRKTVEPMVKLPIDESGKWGPFEAEKGSTFEFFLKSDASSRDIHYYRTAFYQDNHWIYLRALPPAASPAGMLLAGLPRDDRQSVVALFTAQQAVIHERDDLSCETLTLSSASLAPAASSNIAWFLYDANNNQQSDGTAIPTFSFLPFLAGVDKYIPAAETQSKVASFNGRSLHFQNWKSESEGLIVLVFD